MRRTLTKIVGCIAALTCAATAPANEQPPIVKAINQCVEVVHHHKAEEGYEGFYKHFDAFYNAATQQVENNAVAVGDQQPLYQFNKCMAAQGFPLAYGKK